MTDSKESSLESGMHPVPSDPVPSDSDRAPSLPDFSSYVSPAALVEDEWHFGDPFQDCLKGVTKPGEEPFNTYTGLMDSDPYILYSQYFGDTPFLDHLKRVTKPGEDSGKTSTCSDDVASADC